MKTENFLFGVKLKLESDKIRPRNNLVISIGFALICIKIASVTFKPNYYKHKKHNSKVYHKRKSRQVKKFNFSIKRKKIKKAIIYL